METLHRYLGGLPAVSSYHDLHVWALSTTETALTVHLTVTHEHIDNDFIQRLQQQLHDEFAIEHVTIQLESDSGPGGQHAPNCC